MLYHWSRYTPAHWERAKVYVNKGASVLDQMLEPEEDWINNIDLVFFDIASPCKCVLGRLFGSYATGALDVADFIDPDSNWDWQGDNAEILVNTMVEHGFTAYGFDGPGVDQTLLTQVWRELIEQRRVTTV